MNTSAGRSLFMRARNAPASKEKSSRSGTATAFIPHSAAFMPYMTKLGAGYIIVVPGRATASVMIWSRSSEPFPSSSSMPAGRFIRRASSSRTRRPVGSG